MSRLINLEQFPIHRPGSDAYQSLVDRCRTELDRDGMFNLENFLAEDVCQRAVSEVMPVMNRYAFEHRRRHNIYFQPTIPDLDASHPALREVETVNRTVCGDQITDSVVTAVYDNPHLPVFLAAVMDKPALYTMADPLARVNVMAYRDGEALNWHFDRSEFTTTLLLQAPEQGGVFEYRNHLRSGTDPNYDGVARLLNDEDPEKRHLHLTAGTLNVFLGKNTAHRITAVEGAVPRIIAVFSFYEEPERQFTRDERLGFYGREE